MTWTNFTVAQGTTLKLEKEADGSLAVVCFLEGSMISTPSGLAAVEDLAQGDVVHTYDNGVQAEERLSWAGMKHCVVRPELADDEAGYPVRILKDAISDGVPFKDLLVTSEHCLFLDGKFVPARMLVNGRSIFYDKTLTSYNYYHIETANHSVIMADGVLTESYLDTGNRASFRQTGNVVSITGGSSRNLTWADAAAPLDVSRSFVEPLSQQFAARAEQAGLALVAPAVTLTDDAELHLETENGMIIRPARTANGRVMFMIPGAIEKVRIVSNASRPCDVVGSFVDDRRSLGVLLGEITIFESNKTQTLNAHLTDASLGGWHALEESDMRWTSGNAELPLGDRQLNSVALLAIQVKAAGPYLVSDASAAGVAIKA